MFQVKISTPKKHFRSPSFAVEKLKIEFSIIAESGFGQFFEIIMATEKTPHAKDKKSGQSLLATVSNVWMRLVLHFYVCWWVIINDSLIACEVQYNSTNRTITNTLDDNL